MSATPATIARRALAAHLGARPAAELLARYARERDPDAFAGLVQQFGPLVLGVCRRVLGPSGDADDAFQAVFLALARRAHAFRDAQALPAWLHRVALRTARKALARRAAAPAPGTHEPADPRDPFANVAWKDVRRVLDEELDALPERVRGPVVLCWLDGLTQDEAAARLGTSRNTLKRRLGAARELLRTRLARRGLAPLLAAAGGLAPDELRADVPEALSTATTDAALRASVIKSGWTYLFAFSAVIAVAACGFAFVCAGNAPSEPAPPPRPALPADRPLTDAPLPPGATARFGSTHFRVEDGISATLSPDGRYVAAADHSTVRVYEAATWRPVRTLTAERFEIGRWRYGHALAFSPDGRRLAFRDGGRYAFVWDLTSGKLVHRFDGGKDAGTATFCAFAPDGLLALSDRESFRFYDPVTGEERRSVDAANVVALSPDGKYFVRSTPPPEVMKLFLCDVATGKELYAFDTTVQNWPRVSFSPDGKRLTLVPQDGAAVEVWDADKRALVKRLPAPEKTHPEYRWRYVGGFTPDGSEVWLGLHSGDVARWDATTLRELPRLAAGPDQAPNGLLPLPDGRTLLAPCDYNWVRIFDRTTGRERPVPGRYGWRTAFALSPDGEFVAVGDESGRIDLLDAATGKLVRSPRTTGAPVGNLVFGPDAAVLGVGEGRRGSDSVARAFWVADGKELWSRALAAEQGGQIMSLDPLGFTDEDAAVVAHHPDHVRAWNTRTGKELYRLPVRNYYSAVSPDGRFLASDDGHTVVLFDLRTGREAKRIEIDPEKWVADNSKPLPDRTRFAWAADGRTLAATTAGDRVCILDPIAGKEIRRFTAHDGKLEALADDPWWRMGSNDVRGPTLSPDGKRLLASALHGRYTALWDARTGNQLARLEHNFQVDGAAFAPDGKSVFTFGSIGLGYRWDVEALIAAQAPKK